MGFFISNRTLSRRHCRVYNGPDGWRVTDLGSRNGTFLNGTPILDDRVEEGDQVEIGETKITAYFPKVDVGDESEPDPVHQWQWLELEQVHRGDEVVDPAAVERADLRVDEPHPAPEADLLIQVQDVDVPGEQVVVAALQASAADIEGRCLPANEGRPLEDCNLMAGPAEVVCGAKAGRAGPNDAYSQRGASISLVSGLAGVVSSDSDPPARQSPRSETLPESKNTCPRMIMGNSSTAWTTVT